MDTVNHDAKRRQQLQTTPDTISDMAPEQTRVRQVVSEITSRITMVERRIESLQTDVVQTKRDFWDDVTINVEDAAEAAESLASVRQQAQVLSDLERSYLDAQKQLKVLNRMKDSPYFGRIDFREDGESQSDAIYLGIASFMDRTGDNFLVYDWRAPISSLYYDYPPGPAQYTAPSGDIHGSIELKRQFLIRNSQIFSVFDTGITIGDQILQEALGQHANAHMKSIVATIQGDQNQIIRDTRSRLLIVEGAAGSGKTSAALQRIAYLLYRFRESLRSENVVLFSPNPLFGSYVSTVLPELGEENMQQTTYQDYLERPIGATFQLEDAFDQMEYILTPPPTSGATSSVYETRLASIQYKASLQFKHLIDRYVDWLLQDGMVFRSIKFRGKLLIPRKAIKRQFYSYEDHISIPNRLQLLARWIRKELAVHEAKERTQHWVDDEIELLDKDAYVEAYQNLRKQKQFTNESFDDFGKERDYLATIVVAKRFRRLKAGVQQLRFINVPGIYQQLFSHAQYATHLVQTDQLPAQWDQICDASYQRLDMSELSYEDATPYVYLKERIEGIRTNTSVRHVFIDEAQDYSPFQFACLKQFFPHARMTVLGDINQTIHVHAAAGSGFDAMRSFYPENESKSYQLTRSYRSTKPIIEFTTGLLGESRRGLIDAFDRDGPKPTVTRISDSKDLIPQVAKRVRQLRQGGHRSIAVICKTAAESRMVYDGLHADVPIHLVTKETAAYKTDAVVIPSYLAKGVEFDAVVVFNAAAEMYQRPHERLLLYTACTRAMHELHIFFVGTQSPFLDDVAAETYD